MRLAAKSLARETMTSGLHWMARLGYHRRMKTVRILQWVFVVLALGISSVRAYSDYFYVDQPLIQPRFDRLIPTFYPTIQPDFNKLRPTTWPLLYPGVPTAPITENLVYPVDQPLLVVTSG